MSDVFISYARSTAAQADRLTDALRGLGYEVWRDDQLPAHLAYGEVIEERLHEAKAVVVIWSVDALQSVWVRSEADRARSLRKLVQISVDGSRLPMPFDQIQCADLAGWAGETDHKGFGKVVESIGVLVADRPTSSRRAPSAVASTAADAAATPPEPAAEAGRGPNPGPAAAPPPATRSSAAQEGEAQASAAPPAPVHAPPPPQEHGGLELDANPWFSEPPPEFEEASVRVLAAPAARVERQPEPARAAAARAVGPSPVARAPQAPQPAAPRPAPTPVPAEVEPEVHAPVPDTPPAVATTRQRTDSRLVLAGFGAAAVAVLIGGGVWLSAGGTRHAGTATSAHAALAKPTVALALAPTLTGVADAQISQAAAGAASEARAAGRPASEAASLAQMGSRIDAILAQLKGAAARPGGGGAVAALIGQLNQTAAQGAQQESATLSHAGDAMASEARNTLRGDGAPAGAAGAMAALRDATQRLHAATADTGKAADAAASLAALHSAFAAWTQVRTDYAAASALYPQVLHARFEAETEAASAAAQRVIAAAGGSRPWLFASGNQKRAYAALQANAATAKTELAQLRSLSQSVSSSSRESELRAAIRQVGSIHASLDALVSSSAAWKASG